LRDMAPITVGVLALQGGVGEHIALLRKAAAHIASDGTSPKGGIEFNFIEVRTAEQLARTDALIIPGGESTTMAIVARRLGLLDPLRQFVK
jgi:5'-phosphate synthase pdxT subunit